MSESVCVRVSTCVCLHLCLCLFLALSVSVSLSVCTRKGCSRCKRSHCRSLSQLGKVWLLEEVEYGGNGSTRDATLHGDDVSVGAVHAALVLVAHLAGNQVAANVGWDRVKAAASAAKGLFDRTAAQREQTTSHPSRQTLMRHEHKHMALSSAAGVTCWH